MARDQNTVAKRLREIAKKRKAEEKRSLRRVRKDRAQELPPLKTEQTADDESKPVVSS